MAETRKSQTGAGNISGWTPGTSATSSLLPGQVTSGQANLANTSAAFNVQNGAPLPAGPRTTPGVSGTSPLTSRISSGWTAGQIAPASGPGQNFGVGTLNDISLASRAATGQPANTGNVITASAYRTPSVPGFLAGAVNDLNSGTTARTAMQAEWLSRLANTMGNSGDDAYLWAEVLRSQGGLNPSGTGGGGGASFGAAITPGAIAREQANLYKQQAQDVMLRTFAGEAAAGAWNEKKIQAQINQLNSLRGVGGILPMGMGSELSDLNSQLANAQAHGRLLADISNRGVGANNLMNRVIAPPNYAAPNGLINGTGYAIPYTSLPY